MLYQDILFRPGFLVQTIHDCGTRVFVDDPRTFNPQIARHLLSLVFVSHRSELTLWWLHLSPFCHDRLQLCPSFWPEPSNWFPQVWMFSYRLCTRLEVWVWIPGWPLWMARASLQIWWDHVILIISINQSLSVEIPVRPVMMTRNLWWALSRRIKVFKYSHLASLKETNELI